MIHVKKLNESFLKVVCDNDIAYELSEAFSFEVPGCKHMPAYRSGRWDGILKIFNLGRRTLPFGLLDELQKFATERSYELTIDSDLVTETTITLEDVSSYLESLRLDQRDKPITIRDYQVLAVFKALRHKRGILVSPTGSGKSLCVFGICKYLTEELGLRVLIVVPTIGLTTQMKSDFADYALGTDWSADDNVHCISAGIDKSIKKPIVVSTFQSIYKLESDWFNQFDCIIADEAHRVIAESITKIFEKATEVSYKIGFTGTLQEMKVNLLVMKGITGQVFDITSTAKLIENKQLVPLDIKAITLTYPKDICKAFVKSEYDDEIKYIVSNSKRNKFIAKLALNCKGTTLILFRFVDFQGIPLYNMIKELAGDRVVHYIDGGVSGDAREEIRQLANSSNDIIVASTPTMSTGVNLPAISTIILAHPMKSPITLLQSIGRGLRLKDGKTKCVLYDLSDNLTSGRSVNTTYKHLGDRLATYTKTGFTFTITNIPFGG